MILSADRIAVERGERRVIDGLTLRAGAGEALAVTGPNGAGKSTLLRALAGLVALAEGSVSLAGWDDRPATAMHFVAHQNAIKLALTAAANVAFWVRALGDGGDPEQRVEDALDRVGLFALAETPAEFLSQGQRRRLALARLVAAPRPVWLLDEPTAGLDSASREAFAGLMAAHVAGGGIILAATHEPLGIAAGELALGRP